MRKVFFVVVAAGVLIAPECLLAKNVNALEAKEELKEGHEDFGWPAFQDRKKIQNFFFVILGAVGLGAVLAYHPFRREMSADDLDQPKIVITYTVVGALVAIIVSAIPAMGPAIFGLGTLMRFRTDLGGARDTGRVILSTVLGLACGMQFWMVAILGTALAWIILAIFEYRVALKLAVRGLKPEVISQAADAYGAVLTSLGCRVIPPRKNPVKGQISFVIRARRGLETEMIEEACKSKIAPELQGTLDWPEE